MPQNQSPFHNTDFQTQTMRTLQQLPRRHLDLSSISTDYRLILMMITCGMLYLFAVLAAVYILHTIRQIFIHKYNQAKRRSAAIDSPPLAPPRLSSGSMIPKNKD